LKDANMLVRFCNCDTFTLTDLFLIEDPCSEDHELSLLVLVRLSFRYCCSLSPSAIMPLTFSCRELLVSAAILEESEKNWPGCWNKDKSFSRLDLCFCIDVFACSCEYDSAIRVEDVPEVVFTEDSETQVNNPEVVRLRNSDVSSEDDFIKAVSSFGYAGTCSSFVLVYTMR